MSDTGFRAELSNGKPSRPRESFDLFWGEQPGHAPDHICISANGSSAFVQTDVGASACEYARMDAHREAARAYLARVVEVTGLDLTKIARKAKLAPSTLTRFANKPEGKYIISLRTLASVSAATGVPVPPEVAEGAPDDSPALEDGDKLNKLVDQQLSLLNRSWDALYDDERAAIVATAKAFISNRPKIV